jgi:hypothetical protein
MWQVYNLYPSNWEQSRKMENKTESVTPETASKGDSQPVSLTKELKEDVKVVTQVLKQKSIKTAGIFALIAAGL